MTTTTSQKILSYCHKLLFLLIVTLAIVMAGCNTSNNAPPPPTQITSTNMGLNSLHDAGVCTSSACEGTNCQNGGCHGPDDTKNGAFTVSGTAYQYINFNAAYADSNAVIEFYSAPGGGDTSRLYTLPVDKYGNFYTTEAIISSGSGLYPALYDKDNARRAFMPRPLVPIRPASCNICHSLSDPAKEGTTPLFTDLNADPIIFPAYMRINNGIISSAGANTAYHASFGGSDPGPNCMQSGCHSDTGTIFSVAGSIIDSDTNSAYALADAAIGLFAQPCTDPPACLHPDPDNTNNLVSSRDLVPKMVLEVDDNGNFYSTIPIDWATDTYPTLANYDTNANISTPCRNRVHMLSAITSANAGDCYSCHDGNTQAAISIHGALDKDQDCNL